MIRAVHDDRFPRVHLGTFIGCRTLGLYRIWCYLSIIGGMILVYRHIGHIGHIGHVGYIESILSSTSISVIYIFFSFFSFLFFSILTILIKYPNKN